MSAYTVSALNKRFILHHSYVTMTIEMNLPGVRLPAFPEDISENIVKFILGGDITRETKSGDLYSPTLGKLEVKCFTSEGPISFTPSSGWDRIYFLDARDWLSKRFTLYCLPRKMNSEFWSNIIINKDKEPRTFIGQAQMGRRPRITWKDLQPQLSEHLEVVFNGSFSDIFALHTKPPVQSPHSQPTCTDDNPPKEGACSSVETLEG